MVLKELKQTEPGRIKALQTDERRGGGCSFSQVQSRAARG
jgi:hypothetical protein